MAVTMPEVKRTIDEGVHAGSRAGQMAVKSIIIVIDGHNVAYSAVLGTISLSALSPGSESTPYTPYNRNRLLILNAGLHYDYAV